jgi:glycosyltransferase involved in cell wall biosynthesis
MIKKSNPGVLIVHPQMSFFGGAELLITELANWLTKRGVRNDILTSSVSKEVRDLLEDSGVIVPENNLKISSTGFVNAGEIASFIKIFRRQIKKIKKNYDVINFHNFPATWCLYPSRKPSVWMLNEPPNLWSRPDAGILLKSANRMRNYVDGRIGRSMDVICVADEFNKIRCLERYKKNPRIVYYGVNYDFFSGGNAASAIKKFGLKSRFVVVQSGVLTENKNQIESVKAIEKLKEKIPDILLVLAGKADERYEKMLQDYIKNKKLEKYVLFTGNLARNDLRDIYKSCDVGLFPVGKQGGWLAPFELLCSGNPIIVSEEMGASSVIRKNNLGKVTRNYSEAILAVWKNYKEHKEQAEQASMFVKKNLSWSIFADKMIKAYKDALRMHQ